MCYSATLTKEAHELEARIQLKLRFPEEYRPYYFQSAFNHQNLYIIPQQEPTEIVPATWGLVPNWAVQGDISEFLKKNFTNNARSESIFEKRSFKDFPLTNRCLIAANGFFEPHHANGTAYPYFCHYKTDEIFLFAGLYSEIDDGLYSTTIITVEANELFSEVHNKKKRMPLVLDSEFEAEWLKSDLEEPHVKELMKVGFTTAEFECYPVTRDLFKRGVPHNTHKALQRIDYPELNEQGSLF